MKHKLHLKRLNIISGSLISSILILISTQPALANSIQTFESSNPLIRVIVTMENYESPTRAIYEGSKVRVKARCVANGPMLPKSRTTNGYTAIWRERWNKYCQIQIKQRDTFGRTFAWDDTNFNSYVYSNDTRISDELFLDDVYTLVSGDPIRISWSVSVASYDIKENSDSEIDINENQENQIWFTPAKVEIKSSKESQSQKNSKENLDFVDGEEIDDDSSQSPRLRVIKEKTGYLFLLDGFEASSEVILIARKAGSKSIKFSRYVSDLGETKFRTNRALKGYRVEIVIDSQNSIAVPIKK